VYIKNKESVFQNLEQQSKSSSKVTGIENKVSKSGDILYGDLNFNG